MGVENTPLQCYISTKMPIGFRVKLPVKSSNYTIISLRKRVLHPNIQTSLKTGSHDLITSLALFHLIKMLTCVSNFFEYE